MHRPSVDPFQVIYSTSVVNAYGELRTVSLRGGLCPKAKITITLRADRQCGLAVNNVQLIAIFQLRRMLKAEFARPDEVQCETVTTFRDDKRSGWYPAHAIYRCQRWDVDLSGSGHHQQNKSNLRPSPSTKLPALRTATVKFEWISSASVRYSRSCNSKRYEDHEGHALKFQSSSLKREGHD